MYMFFSLLFTDQFKHVPHDGIPNRCTINVIITSPIELTVRLD